MASNVKTHITVREDTCVETKPQDCGLIVFGASGDLARRKIYPALFSLSRRNLLPDNFYVLGFARTEMSDDSFRDLVQEAVGSGGDQAAAGEFIKNFRYVSGEYTDLATYSKLQAACNRCAEDFCTRGSRIFYLALPPQLVGPVVDNLAASGLSRQVDDQDWARVICEKPFGRDLESALALHDRLRANLEPDQIYRMDHYLGKETVQSILMFRFANAIFEPIWNRRYIRSVEITAAETIGVGHRAGYYEGAGLLRDMFQNHMLQMTALVGMEPPISFQADQVRDERVKLLRSIRPFPLDKLGSWIVRGQYIGGRIGEETAVGYRQEKGVAPDSQVETFVAAKVMIDNWRWQGVPFFLRSGKRLAEKRSEIAITFRRPPHSMFAAFSAHELPANVLVLNVQPREGVSLSIQAKQPGPKNCMATLSMDFDYREVFGVDPPDAYQRLILDCMLGDQTLFWRRDGVEAAWRLLTPVLDVWAEDPELCPMHFYEAGSWGPPQAARLMTEIGLPCRLEQL